MFQKILIANRSEIAVRVIRACRELGIRAVAVYSDADRAALHVRMADEAYPIGPAPSRESYLAGEKIVAVAHAARCDAIHPGYGFLSENATFARDCAAAGLTFIGPSAEAMEKLGSKTAARQLARQAGVPMVPGTLASVENSREAAASASDIGFPVLLKAVAGGGGKGMRLVESATGLDAAWRDASSEAVNAFGDGRLYLEKYLARPRHIEIQLLGDHHSHMVYLGERECSVQRRYQKVIEEAPSAIMTTELRRAMGEAAVNLARAGGYTNAGTVEFLVDAERNFYFLEMNTRLQVEHPVTEMVTSLDLVKLQIHIATGEPLPFAQRDVAIRGHAIECRIYAEDPDNNFFPSPGKILDRRVPTGPGVRMDDGVYSGWTVPTEYDPLLGKLIVWDANRPAAIARMQRALCEFYASGIKTNVSLFRRILSQPDFQSGAIHTHWLDELLRKPSGDIGADDPDAAEAATLAAALWHSARSKHVGHVGRVGRTAQAAGAAEPSSLWKDRGRQDQLSREPERHDD